MHDKRPFILLEEGFSRFRWTHGYVEDVAQAITLAVVNDIAASKVYNVGQLNTMTMFEWVEKIGKISNWNGEVLNVSPNNLPESLRFDDLNTEQNLVYDTSLIRLELGFKEVVSLEEGLFRTIEWEKMHPKTDYNINEFNYDLEDEIVASMK
jgi:nucleoside-diphosphate-sugar epimerase